MTYEPAQTYIAVVRNGLLTSTLPARSYARRVARISITGPNGSTAQMYVGPPSAGQVASSTTRGSLNTYEASSDAPVIVPAGMEAHIVWNTGTGSASATWYMAGV